jgi:hypothetical protein
VVAYRHAGFFTEWTSAGELAAIFIVVLPLPVAGRLDRVECIKIESRW